MSHFYKVPFKQIAVNLMMDMKFELRFQSSAKTGDVLSNKAVLARASLASKLLGTLPSSSRRPQLQHRTRAHYRGFNSTRPNHDSLRRKTKTYLISSR
jgi:hypothetical protein